MQVKVNESSFKGQPIYVGIDVHLKQWSVSIMTDNVMWKTFSSPPRADKLYKYLVEHFPGADYYTAYEAGFSGFWLHRELNQLGVKSIVVNPADIPTTNKDRNQKEDKRDSRKIVQSLRAGQLVSIHVPSEKMQYDRSLVRVRHTVVKDLTRIKNRIKSLLYMHGIDFTQGFESKASHWSKRFMSELEALEFKHPAGKDALHVHLELARQQRNMLLRVNRQIRELSKTPEYKENVELLISIPGIGLTTAMTFLTELDDINRFKDFPSLCSYIGLIPSTHSSGGSVNDTGITSRKNFRLRSSIVESAWIAIRHDPALLLAYENLKKRMEGNKAIIRIAKKLLNRMVCVLRKKQNYEKGVVR